MYVYNFINVCPCIYIYNRAYVWAPIQQSKLGDWMTGGQASMFPTGCDPLYLDYMLSNIT